MFKALVVFWSCSLFIVSASEHVMVWTSEANLYNEAGRAVAVLSKGELVEAIIHPKDNSLYAVKYGGKRYNAARKSFKSLQDMVVFYKKALIDYQGVINRNTLRVSAIESDLLLLYIQSLELQRDTAIAYKKVSVSTSTLAQIGYRSMLSEGKLKKLLKVWMEQHAKLITEKKSLMTESLKMTITYDKAQRQLANLGVLIEKFSEKKGRQYLSLYVKSSKGARLYKDNKIVKYESKGKSMQGIHDPDHEGWYKVLVDNVVYRASAEDVVEADKYLESMKVKLISSAFQLKYFQKEVEAHQFRLKLYQGVSRQLEADKFVAGGYGVVKNYVIPIDQNRTFTLQSPDANKLYINTRRATRVLEQWKVEAAELSELSLAQQRKIVDLQKAEIDLKRAVEDMEKGEL